MYEGWVALALVISTANNFNVLAVNVVVPSLNEYDFAPSTFAYSIIESTFGRKKLTCVLIFATLAASVDVNVISAPSAVPDDHLTKGPPLNVPAVVGLETAASAAVSPSLSSSNNAATSVPVSASVAVNFKPATVTTSPAFISLNVNTVVSATPASLSAMLTPIAGKVRDTTILVILPLAAAVNAKVAPVAVAVVVAQLAKGPAEKLPANVGFVRSAAAVAWAAVLPAASPANALAT